jgi:spermidine synthase
MLSQRSTTDHRLARPVVIDTGIALAAVGFTSTVSQVVLMRELVAAFYGTELLYGLALAAWLAWVAVGAWGIGHRVDLIRARRPVLAAGLGSTLPLLVLQLVLLRGMRMLLDVTPGAFIEFGTVLVVVLLIPALFCPLAGFLFTLGMRLVVERGGTAGEGYVWECIGAVAGGVLVSFVFIQWLDPFQTVLLAGALNLALALWLVMDGRRDVLSPNADAEGGAPPLDHPRCPEKRRGLLNGMHAGLLQGRHGGLPLRAILLVGAALVGGALLNASTLRWQWNDLVFAADSPYGRLTVQARAGQRVFFENGLLAFETQSVFPEEVVHFPLLAHPDPRRVLLIGGGVAGDLAEVLKHPVTRVVYVELDPLLIEAARAQLPAEETAPLDDGRVSVVMSDGRRYVRSVAERFDVVVLDLPPPSTGALNRFYTRQFFAEVRAILTPGGVFALGLPSAENYWSPELARRNASIYDTLRFVFPDVVTLASGDHLFFLASPDYLQVDPVTMTQRLTARGIATRQVTPAYLDYILSNDRLSGDQTRMATAGAVHLNEDLAPICYYYDLALWLSRFYPGLRGLFERAGLLSLAWLIPPLVGAVLLARWRRHWAVPIAIGGVGLAQMMLEVAILFAFQTVHGTVYAGVSLIVAAFMAGLAMGGVWGNRLLAKWGKANAGSGGDGPVAATNEKPDTPRRAFIAVQIGVVLLGGATVGLLWLPAQVPEVAFALLAVAAGCLPGLAFPLAVALVRGGAAGAVGRLYGADLLGGALGAGLCATLLVPLLGIPQVCLFIALAGLAGVLCLL